jgi:molybdenum cofactor biosynthesis enzyme MoaA
MASSKIFCNVPWFHLELRPNGSFEMCCNQTKETDGYSAYHNDVYNIKQMSIRDWYNSDRMKSYRLKILGDTPIKECTGCYNDEKHGNESYRITHNWRSVIFTRDAFTDSFEQSPHYPIFQKSELNGEYDGVPLDLHVSMGNECNLACKFCHPSLSTKIASKYKIWSLLSDKQSATRESWMDDDETWLRFCNELLSFKHLRSVHFMGGEPTLSPRLEQFFDFFIDNKKTDFAVSFVTNGTKFCSRIISKMKKFQRADIDISIESILDNNYYIRQGLKKEIYLDNVKQFLAAQSDNFYVTLKPVISALTIPTFPELIEYFFDNKIFTESNICWSPEYLQVSVLPKSIRDSYIPKYERLLDKISKSKNYNQSNLIQARSVDTLYHSLYNELNTAFNMLKSQEPTNAQELQKQMVYWLAKWDKAFGLNAHDYYPDWSQFLNANGYQV